MKGRQYDEQEIKRLTSTYTLTELEELMYDVSGAGNVTDSDEVLLDRISIAITRLKGYDIY